MVLEAPTIDVEMARRQAGEGLQDVATFQSTRAEVSAVAGVFTAGARVARTSAVNMVSGDRWYETDTNWEYRFDGTAWKWMLGLYKGTDAQRGGITPDANDNGAEFLTTDTVPRKFYRVSSGVWALVGNLLVAGDAVTDYTDSIGGAVADALAAIPNPADAPADADALREDLVTNVLPKIRDAFSSIASKENATRAELRQAGVFP
jgi:hypothetical protein